jgi:hypothetical protein
MLWCRHLAWRPALRLYGHEVLQDLREHHDPIYGCFSRLTVRPGASMATKIDSVWASSPTLDSFTTGSFRMRLWCRKALTRDRCRVFADHDLTIASRSSHMV